MKEAIKTMQHCSCSFWGVNLKPITVPYEVCVKCIIIAHVETAAVNVGWVVLQKNVARCGNDYSLSRESWLFSLLGQSDSIPVWDCVSHSCYQELIWNYEWSTWVCHYVQHFKVFKESWALTHISHGPYGAWIHTKSESKHEKAIWIWPTQWSL